MGGRYKWLREAQATPLLGNPDRTLRRRDCHHKNRDTVVKRVTGLHISPRGSVCHSKGLDNFITFLFSEALGVETKVGRMYPPRTGKVSRGISNLL